MSDLRNRCRKQRKGVEKYLGSGLIKGIGPVSAKRIVEAFGTEALNIIEEDPDRLLSVKRNRKGNAKKNQGKLGSAERDKKCHAVSAEPRLQHRSCR